MAVSGRWRWSATVQSGTTMMDATGYAETQEGAMGEAERMGAGLTRLIG